MLRKGCQTIVSVLVSHPRRRLFNLRQEGDETDRVTMDLFIAGTHTRVNFTYALISTDYQVPLPECPRTE